MNLLIEKPKSLFLKYLIPSLGSAMVISIYILADAIAIGQGVGPSGLSALNITTPILCLIVSTGLLFGIGGSALMSYHFGQHETKEGQNCFTISTIGIAICALAFWVIYTLFLDQLLYFMGGRDEIFTYAKQYMKVINIFIPVMTFSQFVTAFVRNDNNPNLSMAAVFVGGITNIVLDFVFVFPLHLGMSGAALASAIGMCLTVFIASLHFFKSNNRLKLVRPTHFGQQIGKIIANGIPSFINELSNGVVVFLFNLQVLKYGGETALSVYSVIANCSIFFSSIFGGVGQAVQPLISTNYGAGKTDRILKFKHLGLTTIGIISLVFAGIGIIYPQFILGIFLTPTKEIVAIANVAFRIYFVAYLFMGINLFASYYLQSTLNSMQAMLISCLRSILLSVGFILVLPILFHMTGIWVVMPLTELLTLVVSVYFIQKYK